MNDKNKTWIGWMLGGFVIMLAMVSATTTISDAGSTYDADLTLDSVDLELSGTSADIKSDSEIDIFPEGSTTQGFRVWLDGGQTTVSALGGSRLDFDDDIFLRSGKSFKSNSFMSFYPDNQASYGLRIDATGTTPTIQSLGSTDLIFDDRLNFTQGFDVGTDKSIKLHAVTSDVIGEPQSIELYADHPEAKPYLAWKTWYDSNDDGTADTYDWTAWLGAHYNTSINSDAHQHWSVETLDTDTGYINTRFEILHSRPVDELFIGMNAVNYLNLKTGVDVRFTEGGTERARLEVNTTDKNFQLTVPDDKHIKLTTGGNGEVRVYGGNLAIEDGKNIISDTTLDIYPSDQFTRSISFEDDGTNPVIKSYGGGSIRIGENDLIVDGIKSDGTGKAVCIKSNGALGTCTTAVGAGGTCTCA